ncbi:hypothetical protein ACFV9W_37805 [Streptomyces sp. NPDC059897]|uniref:SpnB-like Rossmann fold domain-containing protein n=1 Tax=Streptomyces sp. NPDC059897 TaxID=3346994 RepID=UPI00364CFE49
MVATKGALAVLDGDPAPDPGQAAVWGVLRSAQTEHPDRFVLLDTDPARDLRPGELEAAARTGAPQLCGS